jgi:dihydrofolate synthase/folylpolyglutamate synthase
MDFRTQDENAFKIIKSESKKLSCPFYAPDCSKIELIEDSINGLKFTYENFDISSEMVGTFQVANFLTAIETVKVLREKGYSITDKDIEQGIAKFRIPARTEKAYAKPLIILDGGHNEASVYALSQMIKKYLTDKKITLLLSFMKDKDYESCLSLILPLCENVVFTCVDKARGESSRVLSQKAEAYLENIFHNDDVDKAYKMAVTLTADEGVLIVAGSFYLASHVRSLFEIS